MSQDTSVPTARTEPDLADNDASNLHAFARLDAVLWYAMAAARVRFGDEAAADPFRGLYLSADQAAASLDREAGRRWRAGPMAAGCPGPRSWPGSAGWARLQASYGLSDAELDVLLIAVAPEIDLRYERVYGYLQDDVSRRRPTVDLALDLVSRTAEEKLAHRALLGSARAARPVRAARAGERAELRGPSAARAHAGARRAGSGAADRSARPGPERGPVYHQDRSGRPGRPGRAAGPCRMGGADRPGRAGRAEAAAAAAFPWRRERRAVRRAGPGRDAGDPAAGGRPRPAGRRGRQ